MTDSDLSTLEALANAATPGPWKAYEDRVRSESIEGVFRVGEFDDDDDAAFCAASRTAIPELISEIRRLRDECDRLNNLALDNHEALVGYEIHHAEEREAVRRLVCIASDAVDSLTEAGYHATAAKLRDQLRIVRGE